MVKPYDVAVMLERDVAAFLAGKARQVLKFAVGHQRRKGCAVQVVRDHQDIIEPMLYVAVTDHNARRIEATNRPVAPSAGALSTHKTPRRWSPAPGHPDGGHRQASVSGAGIPSFSYQSYKHTP